MQEYTKELPGPLKDRVVTGGGWFGFETEENRQYIHGKRSLVQRTRSRLDSFRNSSNNLQSLSKTASGQEPADVWADLNPSTNFACGRYGFEDCESVNESR